MIKKIKKNERCFIISDAFIYSGGKRYAKISEENIKEITIKMPLTTKA
jgi:hypothetical protein